MLRQAAPADFAVFDLDQVVKSFPDRADTLLLDTYMIDESTASARVFRVYRGTPPHYHANSDEHLFVLSGRGTFWMGDPGNAGEFAPGQLLFFKRGVIHALPEIRAEPVAFLALDVPRRDPKDVIFVDPQQGSPESFIKARAPVVR